MNDKSRKEEQLENELQRMKRQISILKDWKEKYKSLVKASPDAVTLTDLEGKIIEVSPQTLKLYGSRRAEDLLGKSAFDLIASKDRKRAISNMEKTLRQGYVGCVEYTMVKKDGSHFCAELDASLIKDTKGKPLAFIATTRDISEQKKGEQALRESEKKYRTIFESLSDVYYRTDREGIVTEISPSVRRQAGYNPEEVVGHPVTDFYLDPTAREEFNNKLKETGSINDYELRLLAKEGRVIDVSVSSHIVFDERGNPVGVEGVLRDITVRKHMEEALRESEQKFRTMVENSHQGIFIIQDGRIVYANEALGRIMGFSHKELLALQPKKIRELVHPEDQDMVWGRMADRLAGKQVPSRYELRAVRKDKSTSWLELISGLIEYQGKPAIQGAVIDITESKMAEEQIKASLEEKEVMLREIHHRVKNNMQIILSLLRIQSHTVREKKTREMFKQSQNRIRSMALIHEALYKSGDLANIDFADYISRMTTHLLSIYREDLGEVNINQEAEGIFLDINRAIPCGLLISELVSNCLKHAFPNRMKGQIIIEMIKDKKGEYLLVVKDSGVGFPDGLDFQNAKTLGLQLVGDLVKQLRGSIELRKGLGTEFIVKF